MKNYAGHRLSPWLGHLMVSRSETARPLLTPGEVMQLPPDEEIVMLAGTPPIRARKVRYYEDERFRARLLAAPDPRRFERTQAVDVWSQCEPQVPDPALRALASVGLDEANAGLRREPELQDHVAIVKETQEEKPAKEFTALLDDEPETLARQRQALRRRTAGLARQVSLDPDDRMEL